MNVFSNDVFAIDSKYRAALDFVCFHDIDSMELIVVVHKIKFKHFNLIGEYSTKYLHVAVIPT